MRCIDILAAFELEINKIDNAIEKPLTDDSLYWINQAVVKFVKDRFNGNVPKRTSYEQNEKRTRDLVHLLCEYTLNTDKILKEENVYFPKDDDFCSQDNNNLVNKNEVYENEPEDNSYVKEVDIYYTNEKSRMRVNFEQPLYNEYEYSYPSNMMFVLNEDVIISDLNGNYATNTSVFECTADSFMYRIANKLTDFHYKFHRARPLRIRTADGFKLLTDKKYKINSYSLGYLKIPTEITSEDPYKNYEDFDDHIWLEIIKIAAQMYIENQADPRYRTITNEVLTQE